MNKLVLTFVLTIASLVPVLAIASTSAEAETTRRSRSAVQADADRGARQVNQDRRSYNSYTDRANDRDPAGDYKGYADWARAALGGSGQARGGR